MTTRSKSGAKRASSAGAHQAAAALTTIVGAILFFSGASAWVGVWVMGIGLAWFVGARIAAAAAG